MRSLPSIAWVLLALLLAHPAARAHTTETILSLSVTNFTGYVINADSGSGSPGLTRDYLGVQASAYFDEASSLSSLNFEYQFAFRLLDPQGNPVPLLTGPSTASDVVTSNINVVLPVRVIPSGERITNATRNVAVALRPAARLSPYQNYSVELRLSQRGRSVEPFVFTGDVSNTPPAGFLHFTNTVSGDAGANVIAQLHSPSFTRLHAISNAPNRQSFQVQTLLQLRRYDAFESAPTTTNVAVGMDVELIDTLGNVPIPLRQSHFSTNVLVRSYDNLPPRIPSNTNLWLTLDLEPLRQLDPVNRSYFARISVSHLDRAGAPPTPGNAVTTASQRLLHFNGRLLFGSIATRFTSINNVPTALTVTAPTHLNTQIGVDAASGTVIGHANHRYGNGALLAVRLLPNGDAVLSSGSVTPTVPNPDRDTVKAVRFVRSNLAFTPTGARADVTVTLPTGLGYRNAPGTTRLLQSTLALNAVLLSPALAPVGFQSWSFNGEASEESKPLWIGFTAIQWDPDTGRFTFTSDGSARYVRAGEYTRLESMANLVSSDLKSKRANDAYYRATKSITSAQVIAASDPIRGSARMEFVLALNPGQFEPHFPYAGSISWTVGGTLSVRGDKVLPDQSTLEGVLPLTLNHLSGCPGCDAAAAQQTHTLQGAVPGGRLRFTPDAGLQGPLTLAAPSALEWGFIPNLSRYAHRSLDWREARFLMAGTFLPGDQAPANALDRPGVLLNTGVRTNQVGDVERPGSPPYGEGLGDYAGFNFRVGIDRARQGESTLAGEGSGRWDLTGRSKYYARAGGVSGIHEAVPGSFPGSATLYGYALNFNNYGLSFLDSTNRDSRCEGRLRVPFPANISQSFQDLHFTCLGDLASARPPDAEASVYRKLDYWNADFLTQSIRFARCNSCKPGTGYFMLGVQAHASQARAPGETSGRGMPLFGEIGFKANGEIITGRDILNGEIQLCTQANGQPEANSRLKTPAHYQLRGPGNTWWEVHSSGDAYFNDHASRDTALAQGFVNLAGSVDVPFFLDLQAHIHTGATTNVIDSSAYVTSGWDEGSRNYFNAADLDDDHRSRPPATALAAYRNNSQDHFRPHARRRWLVFSFDMPLSWSPTARQFSSFNPVTDRYLLVEASSRLGFLRPDATFVDFALTFDSIPTLSLANFIFDKVDESTGALTNLFTGVLDQPWRTIQNGFLQLDSTLDPDPSRLFVPTLLRRMSAQFDGDSGFIEQLRNAWQADGQRLGPQSRAVLDLFFGTPGQRGRLTDELSELARSPDGLTNTLSEHLRVARNGFLRAKDLFDKFEGKRTFLSEMVGQLLPGIGGSIPDFALTGINSKLDEILGAHFGFHEAELDAVTARTEEMQLQLDTLRRQLAPGREFAEEIRTLFAANERPLTNAMAIARREVERRLAGLPVGDDPLLGRSEQSFRDFVFRSVRDPFLATPAVTGLQTTLRHRLYDLRGSESEALNSGLVVVQTGLRGLVSEILSKLDTAFREAVGLNKVLSFAQLTGHAQINGDTLTDVRMDGKMKVYAGKELEFGGYFQIKELTALNTPTACIPASGRALEVRVGAFGVPVSFLGSGWTGSINLKAAFNGDLDSFGENFAPINLGGSVQLNGGSSKMETIELNSIGLGASLGVLENYLSCQANLTVGSFKGGGGVFFGSSCSKDALFWDPAVADVIGAGRFSGIYAYAEISIPVTALIGADLGCLLELSASAGIGFGAFIEGPVGIGKAKLGLAGQFLCIFGFDGQIYIVGRAGPDGFRMKGRGDAALRLGICPFCIEPKIGFKMSFRDGEWEFEAD